MIAGTAPLIRLNLRRDRVMIPLWLLAVVGTAAGTVESLAKLYPTVAGRKAFAQSIEISPGLRALTGRIFDDTTIGGLTAWRIGTIGSVLLGLMSIFIVSRHTRAEEEAGRFELLGATAVSRAAPLAAALAVSALANFAAALLIGASVAANGQSVGSSMLLGFALGGAGLVFTGIAAVAVQLPENARTANSLAIGVLAASFVLRAVADTTSATWLSWLTPIGWAQQAQAFAANRVWVLGVMVVAFGVLVAIARGLRERRDVGAGLWAARVGPADAGKSLTGVFGLAWRLHRGSLIGWTAGFVILGATFGAVSGSLQNLAGTSAEITKILHQLGGAGGLVNVYFASLLGLLGLAVAGYAISVVLRMRAEETEGRAEVVLATQTSRTRWVLSHLGFVILGPVLVMGLAGLAMGLAAGVSGGKVFAGGLAQVAGIWVVGGLVAAIFGVLPRALAIGWGLLATFVILAEFGPTLGFSQLVMDISPFAHVGKLPSGHLELMPLLILVVLSAILYAAGIIGLKRRDIG